VPLQAATINNLSSKDLNEFLAKLKELGAILLDSKIYEGLAKSGGL
jgi:phage FluMu protein gp41